jgi:hypothetical protein
MQDDRHAVSLRERSHVVRAGDGAFDRGHVCLVVEGLAAVELRAAVRELHEDWAAGLPRRCQHCVDRVTADHVHRRQRALLALAILEEFAHRAAHDHARFELQLCHALLPAYPRWASSSASYHVEARASLATNTIARLETGRKARVFGRTPDELRTRA